MFAPIIEDSPTIKIKKIIVIINIDFKMNLKYKFNRVSLISEFIII